MDPLIVNYSPEKPPIYDRCVRQFGVDWDRGVIITYGDTIHCKYQLPPHRKIHEQVHVRQQTRMGKEKWWDQYFSDPAFRLTQEVEAYKAEIAWVNENFNRETRREHKKEVLHAMAHIYGNMCTKDDAEQLLYGD